MLEGMTCVYRSSVDLYFYVMGSFNENEVIIANNSAVESSSYEWESYRTVTAPCRIEGLHDPEELNYFSCKIISLLLPPVMAAGM